MSVIRRTLGLAGGNGGFGACGDFLASELVNDATSRWVEEGDTGVVPEVAGIFGDGFQAGSFSNLQDSMAIGSAAQLLDGARPISTVAARRVSGCGRGLRGSTRDHRDRDEKQQCPVR